MEASRIFHGLNESQKRAVITTDGPVLVVAGPGTGKTLTIVRRIAYLVHQGVRPENILAVTFTNRAAREMRERAEALLENRGTLQHAPNMFIGTFHLLGLKILKDILPNDFVIYNRDEQVNLLKPLTQDYVTKAQQAAEKISKIKNFLENADDETQGIYQEYQAALHKNSAFDFDDLIRIPIEMFGSGNAGEKYRSMFRYIIVDEYQDINPAQYRLLRLLTNETDNICAVGDSDQAIYAFRGADIENFLNFKKDFEDATIITLTENYRSTGVILKTSNILVKNNLKRIDKELTPIREKGNRVTIISVPDEKAEGEAIIREIEERIGGTSHYQLCVKGTLPPLRNPPEDCSYSFSNFAVIYRTNAQATAMEEAFSASGIPYQVTGGTHPHKRREIIDILRLKLETLQESFNLDEFVKKIREESGSHASDLALLENLAIAYRDMAPREMITNMINEFSLLTSADTFDPRADAVTLMTLHMAKGLEFKVVFIAGVEDGLIPYTTKKDSTDVEEERRLFYVGMTRAKDELFLIHARNRFLYGQRLARSPSPFIREIPEEYVQSRFIPDRIRGDKKDSQMGLF